MKHIRDSIWGEIILSDLAVSIIDTRHFQHLHHIRQTGAAYKVFPSANTTRFEHSIGVYHITKEMIEHLIKQSKHIDISERKKDLISIIGLVHDLGHGPFSHLFDEWIIHSKSTIPLSHEERSCWLFKDLVSQYKVDIDPDEVEWICQRIHSPPKIDWYDTIICNPYSSFDTDKIDYLIRDAAHFGIAHAIDVNRILKNMRIIDNQICFCDRIQDEISTFFEQRGKMYSKVYRHPTVIKAQKFILQHAFSNVSSISSIESFLSLTDYSVLLKMNNTFFNLYEERKIKNVDEDFQVSPFLDVQKTVAFQNTLFYNRKNPKEIFHLNF